MALTPSMMIQLQTKAPKFSLLDVRTNKIVSLTDFQSKKALLVMFICKHCPYVIHVQMELAKIGRDYENQNIGIVAISANDAKNYPDDSPDNLKRMAMELDFRFPLLYDETQAVAKAYKAACTPDFFLFDAEQKLVYRGQLDDSRPGNSKPVDGNDLRKAMDLVLQGKEIKSEQTPSMGCNIKWKTGQEPSYFGK